jgi:hypothetical protein
VRLGWKKGWLFALGVVLLAGPAIAEIYWWIDESGNVQSTSDPSQVPPEHRERTDSGTERITIVPQIQAPSAPEPASIERTGPPGSPASPASEEERIGGKSEPEWRRGYQMLQSELAGLERRLEYLERNPHERAKTRRGRDRLASRWAEVQQVKRDLESTRERLESYEDKARQRGGPPGWLR